MNTSHCEVIHAEQIKESLVEQVRRLSAENTQLRTEVQHLTIAGAITLARADRFQQRLRELDGPAYLEELRTIVAEERALTQRLRAMAS